MKKEIASKVYYKVFSLSIAIDEVNMTSKSEEKQVLILSIEDQEKFAKAIFKESQTNKHLKQAKTRYMKTQI